MNRTRSRKTILAAISSSTTATAAHPVVEDAASDRDHTVAVSNLSQTDASRTSSHTNLSTPASSTPASSTPRLRRYSSASPNTRLSMPAIRTKRSSTSMTSLRSVPSTPSESVHPVPPVPPVPPMRHMPASSDAYKPVAASRNSTIRSATSSTYTPSATQSLTSRTTDVEVVAAADPYAKADELLARARSKIRSNSQPALATRVRDARDAAQRKGLFASATAKLSAGLARRRSSRSLRRARHVDELTPNGLASAATLSASDEESVESEHAVGEQAAIAAGSVHKQEQEQEQHDEDDDDDDDSSSDDHFYDAPLADICEADEEQEETHAHHQRRTKSTPDAWSASHNHSRARSDTSAAVQAKAARVAKLTASDVRITTTDLRHDIQVARHALNLFLNSHMIQAERIIQQHADTRLYYALGYALIATIKAFMTFEPEHLAMAISLCKDALTIANLLRKPSSVVSSFGRFVRGTGQSASALCHMDDVQRHAELVYAESVLLKAVLGIAYAGDFFAFVSEAFNMRNAYGIYRSLLKYVDSAEHNQQVLDNDFKSGVYLGNGMMSMILGLVPANVLKIMEVFGYTGDTAWALKTLSKPGGWSADANVTKPGMAIEHEGVRRQICDMSMLVYHLVISTFIPVNGVDIEFADKVLHYNLRRYPQGVFFLYFSGRLYSTQALAHKAITQFEAARDIQTEYVQLQHMCIWDLSLCHMSLANWKHAHHQFAILADENNWSKAVYTYGRAATLYECALKPRHQRSLAEAATLFSTVPQLTQKIAGKSIPMEKFVSRKAKKFCTYQRLLLPGLEFAYVYHCLSNAPRHILLHESLPLVSHVLAELHNVQDVSQYHSGEEYYDDLCLAHLLHGVCLKFIAHPERHSKPHPETPPMPRAEAAEHAEHSFRSVLQHGARLRLEHWLVYFAHYELGRLYTAMGRVEEARHEFGLVLAHKLLEDRGRRGKYSLQNMVQLRANGALNALDSM